MATPTRSSREVNMPDAPRRPAGGPELDELRQPTKLNFEGFEDYTWTDEELDAWLKDMDPDVQIFLQ